ncbi:MAG: hypothetical protein JHC88_11815 [Niveispirillum sp.]|nr:hypothetical protein [Niveispirillum sp.]
MQEAIAGAAWSYVGKPALIHVAKGAIDNYFDQETAAKLKGYLDDSGKHQELLDRLDEIKRSLGRLAVLANQNIWITAWNNYNAVLVKLHTSLQAYQQARSKFLTELQSIGTPPAGGAGSDPSTNKLRRLQRQYYTECAKIISGNGASAHANELLTTVTMILPTQQNQNLLELASSLMAANHTDIIEYNTVINRVIFHTWAYVSTAALFVQEAMTFHEAMADIDYKDKPTVALVDNPISLDDVAVRKLVTEASKVVDRSNRLEARLRDLAATGTKVGIRSGRWGDAERGSYDCYLTGEAEGTPLSRSWAVGVGRDHGKIIQEFSVGLDDSRLHVGLPQIFITRPADNKSYPILEREIELGVMADKRMLASWFLSKPKMPDTLQNITNSSFDEATEYRLRTQAKSISATSSWGNLARSIRDVATPTMTTERNMTFVHDHASQNWKVELVETGKKTTFRFKHEKSGQYLSGMRDMKCYLSMDDRQSQWHVIITPHDNDVVGKHETDRICFILRSTQDRENALCCHFSSVQVNEAVNPDAAQQRFQLHSW